MPLKQAVIGCGRWGSFHLWYGQLAGNSVMGWEPPGNPDFRDLQKNRENRYLRLPRQVVLTEELEDISDCEVMVVTIPA